MSIRPNILIETMVSESAFNGARHLNLFALQHFGLTRADIFVENESKWTDGLNFDWDRRHYFRGYFEMLRVLGWMNGEDGIDVTCHGWDQYFFCVTADLKEASQRSRNTTIGNMVTVDFKFKASLTENVRILCYSMTTLSVQLNNCV